MMLSKLACIVCGQSSFWFKRKRTISSGITSGTSKEVDESMITKVVTAEAHYQMHDVGFKSGPMLVDVEASSYPQH
jgi:hypothetical protein